MKSVYVRNGGGLMIALAVVSALAACAVAVNKESDVQYGKNGERLVSLTLTTGAR
jgi:hypothetical protein